MAELDASDVESFTNGRLSDDDATARLLASALAAARRYCGWHVSPVREGDEIEVDGPGGRVLSLPTLNLVEVSELSEVGVSVDVGSLDVSRRKGNVVKQSGACWTSRYAGIAATITHGFTEDEAADFREGVLRLVDMMAREGARDSPDLVVKKIDDVQYQWSDRLIDTDTRLSTLFAPFRILPSP
ncbi:MAG: hypothetical protein E6Q97_26320 [Desulfurellales bacterium]|nr:MAG: hypothetical protein E6Q97_26320 [Desulfurellales bacterium]